MYPYTTTDCKVTSLYTAIMHATDISYSVERFGMRRSAAMNIGSGYMFQYDGTSDGTSEGYFDGLIDGFMGIGPVRLGFWRTDTNRIDVT